MPNVTVTGADSTGIVVGLKPAKIYLFRVLAENRIGKSEPSKPVEAITQEEEKSPIHMMCQRVHGSQFALVYHGHSPPIPFDLLSVGR
ncbi:down syndrome cell adhesion molecule-like protein 1 [Trichonephila clavipes]|nr:down syndrome cell adhesion molecule-like protein 1 [Trichonephila clavipes]